MKIVSNNRLIKKNKKIGQILTIGALIVLAIGLYYSFTQPEQITITFGALLFGFLMTQIGIYFGNRWGRSPRPDELLTSGLKGLEDKYTLYHYVTDVPHALIGPAGIIALVPISVGGTIIYDENKNRFRQKGGNLYLKIFGQEGLGRPDVEAQYTAGDLEKFLKKKFPDIEIPSVDAILVFTNPKARLETNGSPLPAIPLEKLKDYVRKRGKEKPASLALIQQIQKGLPEEDLV
ncbi:MAG: hypothetical protein AB1522_08825 [Chloroflexota bacterium]